MKKTAKIFLIIGAVFAVFCLFPAIAAIIADYLAGGLILILYIVFSLVIALYAKTKLDEATKKDELLGIGILTLLFCNMIAGILILCLRDEDLSDNIVSNKNTDTSPNLTNKDEDIYEKLKRLKKMFDEGIIDEEIYQKKRSEYLTKL